MNQRNYSIDLLKFLCAALVVAIHAKFKWYDVFSPLTTCAVPCFLMISGFLLYSKNGIGRDRLLRQIKHVFHIIIWATLIFMIVQEVSHIIHGEFYIPSLEQWVCFIFLNENPFGFHLWYLGAYLYVLFIMMVVDKYKVWNWLFCLTPLFILGDLVLGKYSLLLFNHEPPFIYVRNFFFVGIPYFALGCIIRKYQAPLLTINNYVYAGGVILFAAMSIIEKNILLYFNANPERESGLITPFLAMSLFMLVVSHKISKPNLLTRIGERDSLYIYILHPLILWPIHSVIKRVPDAISACYSYIAPLVVLILTIFFVAFLRKVKLVK